jgi:hypothetical protein
MFTGNKNSGDTPRYIGITGKDTAWGLDVSPLFLFPVNIFFFFSEPTQKKIFSQRSLKSTANRIRKTRIGPCVGLAFSNIGKTTLPAAARLTASLTEKLLVTMLCRFTAPSIRKLSERQSGQVASLRNQRKMHSGQKSCLQQQRRTEWPD